MATNIEAKIHTRFGGKTMSMTIQQAGHFKVNTEAQERCHLSEEAQ